MAVTESTLGALERRIDLSIPAAEIEQEVASRLQRMSRTIRMQGFRPGKVPMRMVASTYGPQVRSEVIGDAIQRNFSTAVNQQKLRVAGYPRIEPKPAAEGAANDASFDFVATFEIYPDIVIGDLSSLAIQQPRTNVGDADIDATIETLRRQRVTYSPAARASAKDDRVTVDFRGAVDGVYFDGGSATDFTFVLGAGRMLPEFETAATGMSEGDSKTFDLTFPADYQGKDVAGKTARFEMTVKKVEAGTLPVLDAEFARSLGVADGDLARLKADIRGNVEREVKKRLASQEKNAVMQGLIEKVPVDPPQSLVEMEVERLIEQARADLAQRGVKQDMPIPRDMFNEQARRRVTLGLILAELVKSESLEAKPEQVRAIIDEYAQSYEDPTEVVRWYYSDKKRISEVEALAVEDNVVKHVLARAQVSVRDIPFDELMARS
ncbi:MAG: trigger factor [Burkholderiales bacterium]|nr:trigger factor [Burkholderiales bacterium]